MLPANASATMIRYDCQHCLYNNRIQLKGPVCLGVLTFYTFTTCSNETLHTVLILVMRHFRTLDMKQLIAIFPYLILFQVLYQAALFLSLISPLELLPALISQPSHTCFGKEGGV